MSLTEESYSLKLLEVNQKVTVAVVVKEEVVEDTNNKTLPKLYLLEVSTMIQQKNNYQNYSHKVVKFKILVFHYSKMEKETEDLLILYLLKKLLLKKLWT